MGTKTLVESDFNELQFEKQLTTLKDSQEAINSCCKWCLEKRVHHKKIVNCWLNVLKRVKIEQRLILFYLANDVVQYSKRRNYDFVASWGTAIQKATTLVRDEKVKHKVLRIFKIWEQRNVYNEEFIADLCGLLNVTPTGSKTDEPHEFHPNYVVNKIKVCTKLEKDTDVKLKLLKDHNPKIQTEENLLVALKDRAHVDDVEKEIEDYAKHIEEYVNALKSEIKSRIALISVLKQAETQLESDRKDVKVVANAYKKFGMRVKTLQKKLDEHKASLISPIPSPDVNAPSPTSDSDIDLPDESKTATIINQTKEGESNATYNPKVELQLSAGYYNSTMPNDKDDSFLTNGFSSFIGSDISFNLDTLNSTVFGNSSQQPTDQEPSVQNPPLPVEAPSSGENTNHTYSTGSYSTSHLPLQPPPMPPFTKSDMEYNGASFDLMFTSNNTMTTTTLPFDDSFNTTSIYNSSISSYSTTTTPSDGTRAQGLYREDSFDAPLGSNPYPPTADEYKPEDYNPEDETIAWDSQQQTRQHPWCNLEAPINIDTPESPPMFEKEGYRDPVEYHDNAVRSGVEDVDQRVLPIVVTEMDDSLSSLGVKDVDHRNLISLTGSPGNNSNPPRSDNSWIQSDQDYRMPPPATSLTGDHDYRMSFNIEQLKLPPPPPPPATSKLLANQPVVLESDSSPEVIFVGSSKSRVNVSDNIESIDMDMDLSDDDFEGGRVNVSHENLKLIVDGSLEPPPPLPDLPDDVDANNLLDDLTSDLHEFSNLSDELTAETQTMMLPPPPAMGVNLRDLMGGPPPPVVPPHLLNTPPPMMPPPMSNRDMMQPLQHPNWLGKDDGMGHNEGGWMVDTDQPWGNEEEGWENEDFGGGDENLNYPMNADQDPMGMPNNWMGPPLYNNNPPFRGGRGNNNFVKRGRGRGMNFNNRGANMNFRGGNRGGFPRGAIRGGWQRGANFRGNFGRGGF